MSAPLTDAELEALTRGARGSLDLRLIFEVRRLREQVTQMSYAASELRRSLEAWARPISGMGSNIQQESRGRAALAFREHDKARALTGEDR